MLQFKLGSFDAMAVLRTLAHSGTVIIVGNKVTVGLKTNQYVKSANVVNQPTFVVKTGEKFHLVRDGFIRRISASRAKELMARSELY